MSNGIEIDAYFVGFKDEIVQSHAELKFQRLHGSKNGGSETENNEGAWKYSASSSK